MHVMPPRKGRGTPDNPPNRFERIHLEPDPDADAPPGGQPATVFFRDNSRSIISYNDSPDIGMSAGINPYRGCEHGCIYCFARPTHEYLTFSAGLDFETKIMVKFDAARLLRKELSAKTYSPQPIGLSGNTDPYQPVERRLAITRQCLRVLADFRNPVAIITKSRLVERDLDILRELNVFQCVKVFISVTTLSKELARKMEPRASSPQDRLRAVAALSEAGIPVGVMVGPVIPGLTDEEIPAILEVSAMAGACSARCLMLRLPYAVKDLFAAWLQRHYPERKDRVMSRIKAVRNGKLNDSTFGSRLRGTGIHAEQIHALFTIFSKRYRLNQDTTALKPSHFRKPTSQLVLFESEL